MNKPRKSSKTGANVKLFLGLNYESQGFMHVQPPRNCPEYQQKTVVEIAKRIKHDTEELLARIYPNYGKEWANRFGSERCRWIANQDPRDFCTEISEDYGERFADNLRKGLWQDLHSPDDSARQKANKEFHDLLKPFTEKESRDAANALAHVAVDTARWLENLSIKRAEVIREVASTMDLWPVNQGIGKRVGFAKEYLEGLGVGSNCKWPSTEHTDAQDQSLFRLAAKRLFVDLLMMKRNPDFHFKKMTRWAHRLVALPEPMTKANARKWWAVAKDLMKEQWDINPRYFAPLIKSCTYKGKPLETAPLYPSEVRRTVIDSGLKKPFMALAEASDL